MVTNIFKKVEILNKEIHKDLLISNYKDYQFTKDAYIAPLGLSELTTAHKSLIIVFIKDASGNIFPAAILGGEKGGNLLLAKDSSWKKNTYIPAILRCYPFGIGNSGEQNFVTIDIEADVLKNKDGNKIIDDNQEFTKHGQFVLKFVQDVYGSIEQSKEFTSYINDLGLLKQANISIELNNEKYELNQGIYIVDENSLNKLESRKLKKLATKGFMKYIYSHLLSLENKY